MSDPNAEGDARLYVTHDAAAHWHLLALTDVIALTVAGGWVYAISRAGVYAARTSGGRFSRVTAANGDTLVPGHDGAYVYTSFDDTPTVQVGRVRRVSGHSSRTERLPCGLFRSRAVAQEPSGQLVAVCGGEPATGQQTKHAYGQATFGGPWHRLADPGPAGYAGFAFASSIGVIVSGGRCPLYLSNESGSSWRYARNPERSGDGFISGGFGDASNGWVIANDLRQKLYLSNTGGRSWRQVLP